MIKAIVKARVEKLLNELEEIATKTANASVSAELGNSMLQKISAATIHPEILKRILSIQNQLHILGYLFNKEK